MAEPLADSGRGVALWDVLLGMAAILPALAAVAFAVAIRPRIRATTPSPADARPRRDAARRDG